MTKLTHSDDYGTPKIVVDYIERNYALCKFTLDACASEHNHKCDNYFDRKQNMFRMQLNQPTFMNPIYGKKGWHRLYGKRLPNGKREILKEWFNDYGTGDFVKFAHDQFEKHQQTIAVLLFANVSSSVYFQKYVGETMLAQIKNACRVFFYPKRICFEDANGEPVGTPSLSSIVAVYDQRFSERYSF